jgi:hypothetical protein
VSVERGGAAAKELEWGRRRFFIPPAAGRDVFVAVTIDVSDVEALAAGGCNAVGGPGFAWVGRCLKLYHFVVFSDSRLL